MKRRTAMQTLIHEISKSPISNLSILNLIENLRLLEVEKDQLEDAWGARTWYRGEFKNYYNDTFEE
jgi:hypothetical protein